MCRIFCWTKYQNSVMAIFWYRAGMEWKIKKIGCVTAIPCILQWRNRLELLLKSTEGGYKNPVCFKRWKFVLELSFTLIISTDYYYAELWEVVFAPVLSTSCMSWFLSSYFPLKIVVFYKLLRNTFHFLTYGKPLVLSSLPAVTHSAMQLV